MRDRKLVLAMWVCAVSVVSSAVFGAPFDPLFRISRIAGTCKVLTPGAPAAVDAEDGKAYPLGSEVITGDGSSIVVLLSEGNEVTVGPNADIKVGEGSTQPKGIFVDVSKGRVDVLLEPEYQNANTLEVRSHCQKTTALKGGKFWLETKNEQDLNAAVIMCVDSELKVSGSGRFELTLVKDDGLSVSCSADRTFTRVKNIGGQYQVTVQRDADGTQENLDTEPETVIKILQKRSEAEDTVVVTVLVVGTDGVVKKALTYTTGAGPGEPLQPGVGPSPVPSVTPTPPEGGWEPMWPTEPTPPTPTTTQPSNEEFVPTPEQPTTVVIPITSTTTTVKKKKKPTTTTTTTTTAGTHRPATSTTTTTTTTTTGENDPPVAHDVSATVNHNAGEQQGNSVAIMLNATDPENDPLTYEITSFPMHGELTGAGAAWTYTPEDCYAGPDSFSYVANDGELDSNEANGNIDVLNNAPTASGGGGSTADCSPVNVSANASDPDGDDLTYEVIAGPSSGSLSGDGPDWTYFPDGNDEGDCFTYEVTDCMGASAQARVSIEVNGCDITPTGKR